ncbi:MAG: phenylalanine--tRNA ligase subunit beta [Hymenobacteraceae bacterium]|nr:phenylalanine--tRNA ligase subunit beta [Hymenobacteraceae bacterium]
MKISLAWLTDLFPAAADHAPTEIARLLTGAGLEVEGLETVERVPGGLRGVVLGTVLTCARPPDADKLSVTTVRLGPAETDVKAIVCGAPNVAAGQRVVVAMVGAELHPTGADKPLVIGKSKIRGQVSEGMICAEDELGLGASHAGILVLATDLPDGTPAAQYFKLEADTVLEIGLTPNRADAASHLGVARGLRALLPGTALMLPETAPLPMSGPAAGVGVRVQVLDAAACPRYAGLSVRGVTVGPSPEWLQRRLRAIGVGPINNVVDVTNYVLHELGQPLHAFDADKIQGAALLVRRAGTPTPFTTLDKVQRTLHPDDLVIADSTGPLVLAGVFGGTRAAVSAATTNVFLEAAYFDPTTIRRASQRHGLKTDSSFRNERGTDPNAVPGALARAAFLLAEVAGGTASGDFQDHYPAPIGPHVVQFNLSRAMRLIGQDLGEARVRELLTALEIAVTAEDGPTWTLHVPAYRVDVTREADVVEDILRLHGFDNIALPAHAAASYVAPTLKPDPDRLRRTLSETLVGRGYHEIVTSSLTWSGHYEAAPGARTDLVRLANANSAELNVLRPTLVPTVLDVLRRNVNRRQRDLKLYEFGRTYQQKESGKTDERETLLLVLTGQREAESWARTTEKASFHDLAGTVLAVLSRLGLREPLQQPLAAGHAYLPGGLTLHRQAGGPAIATVGVLDARQAKAFDVEQPVYWAELDWAALVKAAHPKIIARELARFPEVRRDLSLVVDRGVTFAEIAAVARRAERKLLTDLTVFDVYAGDRLDAGKKAVAVAFTLQDTDQTLTDKVIDGTMSRLMQQFERQLGATLRR